MMVVCSHAAMSQPSTRPAFYKGYRFPPEIISRCVWLYYRVLFHYSAESLKLFAAARSGTGGRLCALRIRAIVERPTRCPTFFIAP